MPAAGQPAEADAIRWGNDVVLAGTECAGAGDCPEEGAQRGQKGGGAEGERQEDPWGDKELREMQLALQEELGRRVTINRKGVGGILTIAYSDEDDLIAPGG